VTEDSMSQDSTIYWGMSQDLIEIHKLHLIQARTPAIDFSQLDSNNRLESRDINPSLPVSYSFFHTSSFLLFFITTLHSFLHSRTTMIPHHRHHPSTPLIASCSYYNVTTSPPSSVNPHQRHCSSTPSLSVNTVTVRQHRHCPPTPSLIAKTLKRLSH
jgi:hypothetical protein